MRIISFLLIWFFGLLILTGQTVQVVDQTTQRPIAFVSVYTPDHLLFTHTDHYGEADLKPFENSVLIIFKMVGYHTQTLTMEYIKNNGYRVEMVENPMELDEFVVSASRWQEYKSEVANSIQTINQKEIEFQNPQTTADMLAISNEVFIQKSQLGGGSPIIRGFSANRILITVDHVRMNNAIFRSGNLHNIIAIDVNSIEHTEVILGPGSVIYGSDALGGVVNIQTIKPRFSTDKKLNHFGEAMTRFSTADVEKTFHFKYNVGGRKFASFTSATFSDFGDLKMGKSGPDDYLRNEYVIRSNGKDTVVENHQPQIQKSTGYNQLNVLQKFRYMPSESWEVNYGFQFSSSSDIPRYDRLILKDDSLFRSAEWYYGPQEWMINQLSITNKQKHKIYDRFNLNLAWQLFKESRNDRDYGDNWLRKRLEKVNAWSLNLDFEKELNKNNKISYGLEWIYNLVGSDANQTNIESAEVKKIVPRYPDGSNWNAYAGYFHFKSRLDSFLVLQTGIRYNRIGLKATVDTSLFTYPFVDIVQNSGALTGNLGINYNSNKGWQIRFNVSSGFKAPNIDDVAKIFDSEPGFVVVPNPNLRSEIAYNIDLGISKTIREKFQVSVSGFYTFLDNAMVRRPFTVNGKDSILYDGMLSEVEALQNVAGAVIYGFYFGLKVDFLKHFHFATDLNYTRGETSDNEPVRHVPPLFAYFSLNYNYSKVKLSLAYQMNGKISNKQLAPSEKNKPHLYAKDENGLPYSPAWGILNFTGVYQVNPVLQIDFGVQNITNQRYRPYSSGIAAAGINFFATMRVKIK
jgi:outer membrane receptor protein involved in Fe transport